jgi:hypothetical protein
MHTNNQLQLTQTLSSNGSKTCTSMGTCPMDLRQGEPATEGIPLTAATELAPTVGRRRDDRVVRSQVLVPGEVH